MSRMGGIKGDNGDNVVRPIPRNHTSDWAWGFCSLVAWSAVPDNMRQDEQQSLSRAAALAMKCHQIDAAAVALCCLLGLAAVLVSATGGEKVAVVLLAIVLGMAIIIVGSLLIGYRRHTQRRVLSASIAPVVALGIIVSVAATHWPMRVSYAMSRSAFDAVAQRVRAGDHVKPHRVGLFTIRRAEVYHNGVVCLWTGLNPSGCTGFVQCGPDYVPFNLWSMVRLDGRWQFISED